VDRIRGCGLSGRTAGASAIVPPWASRRSYGERFQRTDGSPVTTSSPPLRIGAEFSSVSFWQRRTIVRHPHLVVSLRMGMPLSSRLTWRGYSTSWQASNVWQSQPPNGARYERSGISHSDPNARAWSCISSATDRGSSPGSRLAQSWTFRVQAVRSLAVDREVKRLVSVSWGSVRYGWLLYVALLYVAAVQHRPHRALIYALRVGRRLLVVVVLVLVDLPSTSHAVAPVPTRRKRSWLHIWVHSWPCAYLFRAGGTGPTARALYRWALNPNNWDQDVPEQEASALTWLRRHSLPVVRLGDTDHVRTALNACARKMDGKPAAATVVRRKRAVLYNALGFAVERNLLAYNPIDKTQWKAPAVAETVDRRVVANTAQVEAILAVVPDVHPAGVHLVAFFGCLYYAGLRPSEAAFLHHGDCALPERGWGRIDLVETAPPAGSDWTDDGETRQVRGLKHRAETEIRPIPIPPELVKLLRAHIDRDGVTEDGRFFRAARGGHLSESAYGRVWRDARAKALTPEQAASPLAGRPYDLRHAAVSLWLNGGVPATEVARRAGHGVAVLLRVYAGCIDGEEELVNKRIERALRASRSRGRIGGKTA
jgi:integrase